MQSIALDARPDRVAPVASPSRRILIVDDEEETVAALAEFLTLHGHRTYEAYDGAEAIRCACELDLDLILLDIGLPQVDGLKAARIIRALPLRKRPDIAAVTGWGAAIDRVASEHAGIDVHLIKPIEFDVLLQLL